MNKFRSAILGGASREPVDPAVADKRGGKADGDDLASVEVARDAEPQRRPPRRRPPPPRRAKPRPSASRARSIDVDLINLSGGGAMIEADIKPRLWDRVDLFLGEGSRDRMRRALAARRPHRPRIRPRNAASTARPNSATPCCSTSSAAASPIRPAGRRTRARARQAQPGRAGRRLAPRRPAPSADLERRRSCGSHDTHTVRLRNISASGALIDCPIDLPEGAELMLDLGDSGQYFATVSWSRGGQAGLVFAEPFDLSAARRGQARSRRAALDSARATSTSSRTRPRRGPSEWERSRSTDLRDDLEGFLKR